MFEVIKADKNWHAWVSPEMDDLIGEIGKVCKYSDDNQLVKLSFKHSSWWFPLHCVEQR